MTPNVSFAELCLSEDVAAIGDALNMNTHCYDDAASLRMTGEERTDILKDSDFTEHGIIHTIPLDKMDVMGAPDEEDIGQHLVFQFMTSPPFDRNAPQDAHVYALLVEDDYLDAPENYANHAERVDIPQNRFSLGLQLLDLDSPGNFEIAPVVESSSVLTGKKNVPPVELDEDIACIAKAFIEANTDLLLEAWNVFQEQRNTGQGRNIAIDCEGLDMVESGLTVESLIDSIIHQDGLSSEQPYVA
ncbi:hypothetical protein GC177_05060 [bacterium]|nr:hypothetical protein [bacterium]